MVDLHYTPYIAISSEDARLHRFVLQGKAYDLASQGTGLESSKRPSDYSGSFLLGEEYSTMPRISKQTANPNVKINTDEVPSQPDHLVKLATSFAAGDPPDVFVIGYRRYGLLQNAGVIEPVEPSLDKSTVIKDRKSVV
jgi:Maltose-binding periplasmic proteins/domains